MAAATAKSTLITNLEAAPKVYADSVQTGGEVRTLAVTHPVLTTSIDDVADIVLLAPIPFNAKVLRMELFNDDLDSNVSPTLAVDVGLYYGSDVRGQTAGTLISATAYASAITTLQAANTLGVNIANEARDIIKIGVNRVFQDAGLTSDPGGNAYIGMKVTAAAATAAAGDVTLVVTYTM
jgi:hypothetical protein